MYRSLEICKAGDEAASMSAASVKDVTEKSDGVTSGEDVPPIVLVFRAVSAGEESTAVDVP